MHVDCKSTFQFQKVAIFWYTVLVHTAKVRWSQYGRCNDEWNVLACLFLQRSTMGGLYTWQRPCSRPCPHACSRVCPHVCSRVCFSLLVQGIVALCLCNNPSFIVRAVAPNSPPFCREYDMAMVIYSPALMDQMVTITYSHAYVDLVAKEVCSTTPALGTKLTFTQAYHVDCRIQ